VLTWTSHGAHSVVSFDTTEVLLLGGVTRKTKDGGDAFVWTKKLHGLVDKHNYCCIDLLRSLSS
jgi:hypothetical protein